MIRPSLVCLAFLLGTPMSLLFFCAPISRFDGDDESFLQHEKATITSQHFHPLNSQTLSETYKFFSINGLLGSVSLTSKCFKNVGTIFVISMNAMFFPKHMRLAPPKFKKYLCISALLPLSHR